MLSRRLFIPLGMLLALIWVPGAQAAHLIIDDSVEGQITLTHDENWEFGVVSNGTPFDGGVAGSTTASGEGANFSGTYLVNTEGNPDPGTGIIYFVDPGHTTRVSDIILASWRNLAGPGFGPATISFQVVSSACGKDLGPLPAAFAGLGVDDPVGSIGIGGLFRDPNTAAVVAIPSNLTIEFVSKNDTVCPITLDHFKCYRAKGKRVDQTVTLEDQFGVEPQVLVRKPMLFCNPVSKNGEEIKEPTARLTCYDLPEADVRDEVTVDNQFGLQVLQIDRSKVLCLPSEEVPGTHK